MNKAPALPAIDSIVFTRQAKTWFNKHDLMPSAWKIDQTEVGRILSANLALTIFNTPACAIPVSDILMSIPDLNHVIVIDSGILGGSIGERSFSGEEAIATILHEIGHFVNPAPNEDCFNDEEWADDYARHCGYEGDLLSALQKLKAAAGSDAVSNQIQRRIARIERGDRINTRW